MAEHQRAQLAPQAGTVWKGVRRPKAAGSVQLGHFLNLEKELTSAAEHVLVILTLILLVPPDAFRVILPMVFSRFRNPNNVSEFQIRV